MRKKKYKISNLKSFIGSTEEGSKRLNTAFQTMKQERKQQRLLNLETWYLNY